MLDGEHVAPIELGPRFHRETINIALLAELRAFQAGRFKTNSQTRCIIWMLSFHKAG